MGKYIKKTSRSRLDYVETAGEVIRIPPLLPPLLPRYFPPTSWLRPRYFPPLLSPATSPRYFPGYFPVLLPHYFPATSPLLPRYFPATSPLLFRYFPATSPLLPRYFPTASPLLPRYVPTSLLHTSPLRRPPLLPSATSPPTSIVDDIRRMASVSILLQGPIPLSSLKTTSHGFCDSLMDFA